MQKFFLRFQAAFENLPVWACVSMGHPWPEVGV